MLTNTLTRIRKGVARQSFAALLVALSLLAVPVTKAEEPGRGITAEFEVAYLKFIINHHYAALRMTELAAGTDAVRNAAISETEGTSRSPGFAATPAKAQLNELKSLARRNNRMQREEILTAQGFLRRWYGIEYQPIITPENQQRIAILESTPAGAQFDIEFMEIFSRHHFSASRRSLECQVASELRHKDLERYCRGIVVSQINDIDEMRNLLCDRYNICDYQPLQGLKGRHSGGN